MSDPRASNDARSFAAPSPALASCAAENSISSNARPRARMFLAALTSRSCSRRQALQVQRRTARPAAPCGPVAASQPLHCRVLPASLLCTNHAAASSLLYLSMVRRLLQPASSTLLACGPRARAWALMSPTTMQPCARTSCVEILCRKSFLRLAILAWIAFTRALLPARWARAKAGSRSRKKRRASILRPSDSVARSLSPRSMPMAPPGAGAARAGRARRTVAFRYQRPRASWLMQPAPSSY